MNAKFFEVTLKAIVAGITIFILIRYIFFLKFEGFWDYVFPSKKETKTSNPPIEKVPEPQARQETASEPAAAEQPPKAVPTQKPEAVAKAEGDGIIGESKTAYITNPVSLKPVPHRSEDLEREAIPEPEPEPTADEVDDTLDAEIQDRMPDPELEPEERYIESVTGVIDTGEFSTGSTFEQLGNAYEVAMGMEVRDERIEEAADTFYTIRGTNLCDFIISQSEKLFALGRMLEDHVENDGTLIKHLKSRRQSPEVVNFDMSKYE